MSLKVLLAAAVVGLVAVEWLFFSLCRGRRRRGGRRGARPLAFVGLNLALVAVLFAGAVAELRFEAGSRAIAAWFELTRPSAREPFEPGGDPGLLRLVGSPRVPPERPDLEDPQAFLTWRDALRARLLSHFDLDPGAAGEVVLRPGRNERLASGPTRSFFTFESFDGTSIPAYLVTPEGSDRGPAVLVVPGHPSPPHESGIRQTAGPAESYQRQVALRLAEAGYVALTFELRGFGYLGAERGLEHRYVAFNALLGGSFYKAEIARDIQRALEVLRSLDRVDPERIGMTGISLGGEIALTYAALDESVHAVAYQSAFGGVGPLPGARGRTKKLQPHYCHIVPGHNELLHQEDWLLLVAPRPQLGIRGTDESVRRDWSWPPGEPPPAAAIAERAYRLLGAADDFDYRLLERSAFGIDRPGEHFFYVAPVIEFFDAEL